MKLRQALTFTLITHLASAQQPGIYTSSDGNPTITLKECTLAGGCTSRQAKLTLDANWRWIHSTSGSSNCYTGNQWSSQFCSDPKECAKNCVVEGVSSDKYRSTYGVEQLQDGVKLNFLTEHTHGQSVGSRLYVMDEGSNDDKYKLFYLKNREFSFDVDVSQLQCGQNGAMYFSEMEANGGLGIGDNNAGAAFGTGYCDAQCPHDIKFIDGEANVIDWKPNPNDLSNNMGAGKYGACCAEMDIWEANSMATAYTPHTCSTPSLYRCEGIECGDNDKGERYDGVCDKDGCDINPYRMGNPDFYGRGSQYAVNTLEPMKVVTQFITSDGTDNGDLVEIRRFYVQNGNIIHSPSSTILGPDHDTDSITEGFCDAKKDLFGDVKDYQEHGGMKGMGESLDRGHVMIFSLWDDVEVNMLWLDSAYPLNKPVTDPGIKRGECPGDETSTPTWLRQNYPDAYVTFKNAAVGEIGSTVGPVTPTTPSPVAAPSPVASPVSSPTPPSSGYCNYRGCDGEPMGGPWCNETQERCEGNCAGTWCTNGPTPTPPTPTPPTPTPPTPTPPTPTPPTGGMTATTTRYWDCSGGSCGCAYLPTGDPAQPSHCHSNAMFEAPTNNPHGAKFYGTAAVSNVLFQDTNGNGWLGEGCGKCYKLTGTSNTPGYSGVETTLVLKAANYCPPENPLCSGNNAHFDISAPGFDVTAYSFAHVCPEREPEEAEGFASCGKWMIDQQDPNVNCDCSKFKNPILRAGCENFYSLQWNNAKVVYEEVTCPFELGRLSCWEENGQNYPPFGEVPQFCASNIDDTPSPIPNPTAEPTKSPVNSPVNSPTSCTDNSTDSFFFKMKTLSDGSKKPIYKTCGWLEGKPTKKINNICTKKTNSHDGVGPAKDVCKELCGTC